MAVRKNNTSKKEVDKIKKMISFVLVIALVVGGVYAYRAVKRYINRPVVHLVQAEPASFNRILNLNAQVESQNSQIISSNYGLTVQKIFVEEGEFVSKGQVLYSYSRSSANNQLRKVNDDLAELDQAEEERKERYEQVFNEMAGILSQQLGIGLQAGTSLLASSLANFDLSAQLQGILSQSLDGLGLDKEIITTTLNALNQALNTGEAAMAEMEALFQGINDSGLTDLVTTNLYQLQLQAQALYDQIQSILDTANNILENSSDLSDEITNQIREIIDRAERLRQRLEDFIGAIKDSLKKIHDSNNSYPTSPSQPSDETDQTNSSEATTGIDVSEPASSVTGTDASEPTSPASGTNVSEPTSGTETSELATEPAASELPVMPEASADQNGIAAPVSSLDQLPDLFHILPARPVLAEPIESGSDAENKSQNDLSLLLALLQMDQSRSQSQRDQLKADQAGLETLLKENDLTVRANMDGLVASLKVKEGEALPKNEREALILDGDHLIATCWVGKQDANHLEEGQKVVYNDGELDLHGEIVYKAAIAVKEPSALDSLGALGSQLGLDQATDILGTNIGGNSTKVEIRMSIEGPDLHLLTIGFDINSEVEIDKVENVLSIPLEALVQERDKYYVFYVDEQSMLRKKEIKLGMVGAKRAEVKSGLVQNESIVINATPDLETGRKVKIANEDK